MPVEDSPVDSVLQVALVTILQHKPGLCELPAAWLLVGRGDAIPPLLPALPSPHNRHSQQLTLLQAGPICTMPGPMSSVLENCENELTARAPLKPCRFHSIPLQVVLYALAQVQLACARETVAGDRSGIEAQQK